MEMFSNDFPVSCHRMTRGMKRLLVQGEKIQEIKKQEQNVDIVVKRCNGRRHVVISRSLKNYNEEEKDLTSELKEDKLVESNIHQTQDQKTLFCLVSDVVFQIKNKYLSLMTREQSEDVDIYPDSIAL